MKIIINFIFVAAVILLLNTSSFAKSPSAGVNNSQKSSSPLLINPLYEMRVGNIQYSGASATGFNALQFDIFILHTNVFESGPFEYAAGEYYFNFNPTIANGGVLTYSIIPGSSQFTNPNAVPIDPTISGKQLRLYRNPVLGAGNGPIISTVFPGTRVVKVKLETTALEINLLELNLQWRDSTVIDADPYTRTFAYIDGAMTEITSGGTLIIQDDPLPVELANFTSNINRNNVVLNWSTISELNNSGFEIERSVSGTGLWLKTGFVQGNGTASSLINYSFEDKKLNSGNYQYRLKQIDYNGNYEYFELQNEVVIGNPEKFNLSQNYPNPFNPATKIDFDLKTDGFVSLKIFDISGREIKTLIYGFKNSGFYTIDFDASALSSGVYFYRLESGSFSSTKKLSLLK